MENFGYVLATKILVENRRKVRFMYREQPDNENDSGWRFFTGDEDQAYVNDPQHIGIYDINTILSIDRSVEKHLNAPVGAALEREDPRDEFVPSTGFSPVE